MRGILPKKGGKRQRRRGLHARERQGKNVAAFEIQSPMSPDNPQAAARDRCRW